MSTSVVVAGRGGPHDGADALRGAAAAADHPAEVAGPDADVEAHAAPALDGVDLHGVGVVDDRRDDVGAARRRRSARRRLSVVGVDASVGVVAHVS